VAAAMVLRTLLSQGTETALVIVSAVVTAVGQLGWRALAVVLTRGGPTAGAPRAAAAEPGGGATRAGAAQPAAEPSSATSNGSAASPGSSTPSSSSTPPAP